MEPLPKCDTETKSEKMMLENDVGKLMPVDLLDCKFHKPSIKKTQYLRSTKWNTIRQGMPEKKNDLVKLIFIKSLTTLRLGRVNVDQSLNLLNDNIVSVYA